MGIDLTFRSEAGTFNYRACGIIVSEQRILAMRSDGMAQYYLPGGRVRMGETAEQAVLREIREELGVSSRIVRPLWLDQSFFTLETDGRRYHELCIYFLMDCPLVRGEAFTIHEGSQTHFFRWLPFEDLQQTAFFPLFLKTEIFHLPDTLCIRTDMEP